MRALVIALAVIAGACASDLPPRPPEPVINTKDVGLTVRVRCEDKREPAPDYPDDPEDLATVQVDNPDGTFDPLSVYILSQKYKAAQKLYRQRLKADDDQIAACAATP